MARIAWWLLTLPLMAACTGSGTTPTDDDTDETVEAAVPDGVWQTKRQRFNGASCSAPGEDQIPVPFFELRRNGDALDFYSMVTIDDANPLFDDLWGYKLVDGNWVGEARAGTVSEQEGACRVYLQKRFIELNDDKIKLERLDYVKFEAGMVDEDDCNNEAATWEGQGGTCGPYEVLTANRPGSGDTGQ